MDFIKRLKFDEKGLIAAVVQEYCTREVLMAAYMNEESLRKTLETGETWFWSRSRQELWNKGATSGNIQRVKALYYDCDGDTLLIQVEQKGNACHRGAKSCFYTKAYGEEFVGNFPGKGEKLHILAKLYDVIKDRKNNPKEGSYTTYLFDKGIDKILKKIGEEAAEVIIASKNPDKDELIYEASDLLYHLLVLLCEKGVRPDEIYGELESRHK